MPKLRHFDNLNTARFITFCCFHRYQLLTEPARNLILLEEIDRARNKHGILIYGYVIMPEHVHLVIHSSEKVQLGAVIGEIKSRSAKRIFSHMRDIGAKIPSGLSTTRRGIQKLVFWQLRCYDHNCRSEKTTLEKIEYCHKNPVTRGLVRDPSKWRWSSFNWYAGERNVPLEMDEIGALDNT
ncbi:MAG: transposase [candidate division Zixibacteria bacterium]|nr:transposase [candidate division Zixibacteria bacterium]